jgi:hypothetical protein
MAINDIDEFAPQLSRVDPVRARASCSSSSRE